MKTFFGRLAIPILLLVFFLVPFSMRGARSAVKNMKNEISDWLPKDFRESTEMAWFWQHFLGERFIIVSWPGCTGEPEDEAFKLLTRKLACEVPPSRRLPPAGQEPEAAEADEGDSDEHGQLLVEAADDSERGDSASASLAPETEAEAMRHSAFGTHLERPYEFVGDKHQLFSTGEYYENWGQRRERWILGKQDRWYFITPEGELYRWNEADAPIASFSRRMWRLAFGGEVSGEHIASLGEQDGPWYYANPRRLDAQLVKSYTTGPGVLDALTREGGVLEGDRQEGLTRLSGALFGPDGKQTCMMLTLTEAGISNFHRLIGRGMLGRPRGRLIELAEESGVSYQDLKLGGPPVDNVAIDEEGTITLVRLVSLCAVLGLGLAYCCFRSISATLIVFFVGGISAVSSIAFVGWFGCSIDAILMSMPSLIYVLGISGAVHIINYYREAVEDKGYVGAPERGLKHGWKPALLCNVTTAIGLVSLCTSELNPIRKFGLFSALAVMSTLILLFTYLPAALQIWPQKPRTPAQRRRDEEPWYEKYLSRFWETIGGGIVRHHYLVSAACILLIVVTGLGVTRINTSVNLLKMFDSNAKILQDYAWLEQNLGKLVPMEIVVRIPTSSMRAPVAEQTEERLNDPEEIYRLSFLERMELADRVQRVVEREFGAAGSGIAGRSLSAVTFAPPLPQARGDNFTFARRGGTNARLEAHRQEFLKSEYLRIDRTDNSELWRVSLRVGALQDVDYGSFINEIKCAVEPVMAAQRERDRILRAIVERQEGKRHVGAKVLLVGAPLGPSKKSANKPNGQATAPVVAANGKRAVDQTRIFAESLAEQLTIARVRLDWHDPAAEPLPEQWNERLPQYDCVVLVQEDARYDRRELESRARLLVDCRGHVFDPLSAPAGPVVTPPNGAFAQASAAAIPATAIPAAAEPADNHVAAIYTGVVPIVYKAQRTLLNSLIQSTVWSFATITPLMILVSRSLGGGIVAMLPNVLPVLVIFGSMGWMNISVDIGSMMTASIALGVAVDDTIHYLSWYREQLDVHRDRHKAIIATYKKCATPTLQAAIISGLGLSIFAFSTFTPTQRFGYLMLSILWAGVVAELIFFPALLASPLGKVFKPRTPKAEKAAARKLADSAHLRIDEAETGERAPTAEPEAAESAGRPHKARQDAANSARRR